MFAITDFGIDSIECRISGSIGIIDSKVVLQHTPQKATLSTFLSCVN